MLVKLFPFSWVYALSLLTPSQISSSMTSETVFCLTIIRVHEGEMEWKVREDCQMHILIPQIFCKSLSFSLALYECYQILLTCAAIEKCPSLSLDAMVHGWILHTRWLWKGTMGSFRIGWVSSGYWLSCSSRASPRMSWQPHSLVLGGETAVTGEGK